MLCIGLQQTMVINLADTEVLLDTLPNVTSTKIKPFQQKREIIYMQCAVSKLDVHIK